MKKRIVSLALAVTFVLASAMSTLAAKATTNGTVKTPVEITLKDVKRLAEVATTVRGKQARIINATRYGNSGTTWVARLFFDEDQCAGDFVLTTYPYMWDTEKLEAKGLPFNGVEEGTAMFGPCWYYFGVFDDNDHNSCGYLVAERIKRWPNWTDLTFSGVTYRGVGYSGSYTEECSDAFIEKHIN